MSFTPEQRATQARLQAAVEDQIAQYRADNVHRGQSEDTGVVTDWVLVVSTTGFDRDGDEESGYYLSYAGGQMPDHRAIGLLHYGIHMIKTGAAPDFEDDD